MAEDAIPTNVNIEVGYMLDAGGTEWVKLTFTAPGSAERFALAYSRDETQRLIDLLQEQVDRMGADVG